MMPPRVLASGPKPCGGNKGIIIQRNVSLPEMQIFHVFYLSRGEEEHGTC